MSKQNKTLLENNPITQKREKWEKSPIRSTPKNFDRTLLTCPGSQKENQKSLMKILIMVVLIRYAFDIIQCIIKEIQADRLSTKPNLRHIMEEFSNVENWLQLANSLKILWNKLIGKW